MTFSDLSKDTPSLVSLLKLAGEMDKIVSVTPCAGGGNNRVFIVQTANQRYLAKWYFSHPSDTRNRLNAEFSFLTYAHSLGLTSVPKPLAKLQEQLVGLYEFVDGGKLESKEITAQHVNEAAEFFLALNKPQAIQLAKSLPNASEACFSINAQLASVQKRVARVMAIVPQTPEDESALKFAHHLHKQFETLAGSILSAISLLGINPDAELKPEQRCISPSDFGFHNVLLRQNSGELCFLDFEYAGWDDPSKMVADFFCQPAIPVNGQFFENFLQRSLSFFTATELLIIRTRLLLPLFRLKWCCIMLNEFLPDSQCRRQFANPNTDLAEIKRIQLKKAANTLELITTGYLHGNY